MGKGIFGKWFREFATLVLTQTVQAFLLAIVMTIIVSCLAEAGSSTGGSAQNAAGLLAIVALASFNKIEKLVKNIFGVTSGFGDPSMENAKGLSIGAMAAFKGGQRLLDNRRKKIEGQRKIDQGRMGALSAASELEEDRKPTITGVRKTEGSFKVNKKDGSEKDSAEETKNQIEEQVVKIKTIGDIGELTKAINKLSEETSKSNKSGTQDKLDKYQDMIREGEAMKRTARRENIGATFGAAAGAIVGMATGSNVVEASLTGAGIGDAIGESSARNTTAKQNFNREIEKLSSKYEENIAKANEKLQGEALNKYYSDLNDKINQSVNYSTPSSRNTKSQIKNMNRQIKNMTNDKRRTNRLGSNIDSNSDAGNN